MTQFDAQLRWLIHFHIQCDGSSMSDGGRYPAYDQSHSLQTHLWMWDVAIFPPVLCVFGEKKKIEAVMAQYDTTKGMTPPPLTWNSPAERVCGMSALWQEVMPVNKPWCVCVCLIEKELSSGPCDSPWSLKLHTWLFPLCHHLMHYSLIWNCYQRFPALTVTRLTDHRNLRVPSQIMTFVTTCGRFLC